MKLDCTSIELLPEDTYAGCGGKYSLLLNEHVSWAPLLPVYKHISKDRYIFYTGNNYTEGWGCGSKAQLSSGSYYIHSKYQY